MKYSSIKLKIDENDIVSIWEITEDSEAKLAESNSSIINIFDTIYDNNNIELGDFYYESAKKGDKKVFSKLEYTPNAELDFSIALPIAEKLLKEDFVVAESDIIDKELINFRILDLTAAVLEVIYDTIIESIAGILNTKYSTIVIEDSREDALLLEKISRADKLNNLNIEII